MEEDGGKKEKKWKKPTAAAAATVAALLPGGGGRGGGGGTCSPRPTRMLCPFPLSPFLFFFSVGTRQLPPPPSSSSSSSTSSSTITNLQITHRERELLRSSFEAVAPKSRRIYLLIFFKSKLAFHPPEERV